MAIEHEPEGDHVAALDSQADDLLSGLDKLRDVHERLEDLKKNWRRDGFTTPAEFYFTETSLNVLANQVESLRLGLERLERGVGLVGRE